MKRLCPLELLVVAESPVLDGVSPPEGDSPISGALVACVDFKKSQERQLRIT